MLKRHKQRKQQRAEESIRRMAIERQLEMIGAPTYVTTRGGGVRGGAKGKKLNVRALSLDQREKAESEAMIEIASVQTSATAQDEGNSEASGAERTLVDIKKLQDELTQQSLQSEEGYREFQEKLAKEEKMENLIKVTILQPSQVDALKLLVQFGFAFSLFLLFWIIGATVFSQTEVSIRRHV
jgi:potassium channel subfamily K